MIKRLPDNLVNKIAAGEVVERPASVVKELVENALDAGSSRIEVTIIDGGKKLIRVSDNGFGIAAAELSLAVARHTTSKISRFEDLYALKTKGFRGEALASICSVAKVTVASRVAGAEASEILVEGGRVVDQRACVHPPGTTVTAKYLFYQTPARLKFLKSAETEAARVVSVLTSMALSHPGVGFRLRQNDRDLLDVPPGQDLRTRVSLVLGADLSDLMYEISAERAGLSLTGLVGHPQIARSQRHHAFFFVNGRVVNDKVLWHAVMEGYRDLLMRGRYPVLVLNLAISEDQVDVNVHPAKAEVRFYRPQDVHRFVFQTIRARLKEAPWLERAAGLKVSRSPGLEANAGSHLDNRPDAKNKSVLMSHFEPVVRRPATVLPVQKQIQFGKTRYADMTPVGQLLGTYILCEADGKLVLIDQHAAHERIGFEKLLLEFKENGLSSRPLLVPEMIQLKPSDCEILKQYLEELEGFGFDVAFFGGTSFAVKAVPALLEGSGGVALILSDVIEDIKATGELVSLKDRLHHVLATMACHAQIRAHRHLSPAEMQALLEQLDHYQFTDFCPHGRPVSVDVTLEEIERWFRRAL